MSLPKELQIQLTQKACQSVEVFREEWDLSSRPIPDLYSLVKSKGFLLLRFPNNYGISGAYIEKKDIPQVRRCIYINNAEPVGRQNYTIAHELYHAYFEKSTIGACLNNKKDKDPIEFTADKFASHLLIPRNILKVRVVRICRRPSNCISYKDLFEMQKLFNVSFMAVVYAIKELGESDEALMPRNLQGFMRFNYASNWDKLAEESKKFGCYHLNTAIPVYEFPDSFKNNLLQNYKSGLTDLETVKEIFDFFNCEFKSRNI